MPSLFSWPLEPSLRLSDLSWGDVRSLCLNCSQSPVILFPTPWLMMPLKFISMLNLVMILSEPHNYSRMDLTPSLTDRRWEPFLVDFYGIVLEGRGWGQKPTFPAPGPAAADNWRLWTWILSDFQCREDPEIEWVRVQGCEEQQF